MTNGGWTYLQRRYDGSLSFDWTYQEYVDGFGDVSGEFWLGLDKIYLFSSSVVSVQLDLSIDSGVCKTATYSAFSLGDVSTNYELSVSGYIDGGGLCSQTFGYNNGKEFSAKNGPTSNTCPGTKYHGWWFGFCTFISINGDYSGYPGNERGFTEHGCGGYNNLVASVMKIQSATLTTPPSTTTTQTTTTASTSTPTTTTPTLTTTTEQHPHCSGVRNITHSLPISAYYSGNGARESITLF